MARTHREGGAAQTASGELIYLGDWTCAYQNAFRHAFPLDGELARYMSGSLRPLNVPAIVARVMAAFLARHIPEARERACDEQDVRRLMILRQSDALERLYARYEDTLGTGSCDELWGRFLACLSVHVRIVEDDWEPSTVQQPLAVAVGSGAASLLDFPRAPPGLRKSHLETIRHLFFISYAVLSRSFEEDFPAPSTAHTCRRSR